jgi:hypothetical protein
LQYANNETLKGMIEDHADRHVAYCERHGYHYFPVIRLGTHFDWYDKIRLILEAFETGNYSHVFWLDADTFVVDGTQDMRHTIGPGDYYAFCIHPLPWHEQSWHFNAGVMYYRDCDNGEMPNARHFLHAALNIRHDRVDEYDQTAINDLLLNGPWLYDFKANLTVLPDKWNCTLGVHDLSIENPPVVAAFHGFEVPDRRREIMREWAKEMPFR